MAKQLNLKAEILITSMCCHRSALGSLGRSCLTFRLGRHSRVLDLLQTLSMSWAKSSEGLVTIFKSLVDAMKCLVLPPAAVDGLRGC